jgi:hypothetical protein
MTTSKTNLGHPDTLLPSHSSAGRVRTDRPSTRLFGQLFRGAMVSHAVGLAASFWVSSCSPRGDAEAGAPSCVPGTVQACSCSASMKGVQECNDKGTFDACDCAVEAEGSNGGSPVSEGAAGQPGEEPASADSKVRGSNDEDETIVDDEDATMVDDRAAGGSTSSRVPREDDTAGAASSAAGSNAAGHAPGESATAGAANQGTGGSTPSSAPEENDTAGAANGGAGAPSTGDPECEELPANFTQDTTLPKGCYLAEVSPSFAAGVTLTLSPGVTIVFAKDTGLVLRETRALVAVGRPEEPIVLTGAEKVRGFWQGVILDHPRPATSRLDRVIIEYAGGTPLGIPLEVPAGGLISLGAEAFEVDNTTIRESAGFGYVCHDASLVSFDHNTITANRQGPASACFEDVDLLGTSTFSGNDIDAVTLAAGYIEAPVTVPLLDVPYYIPGAVHLYDETLTVNPGVTFFFGPNAGLVFREEAALLATGSADDPVVFTGLYATPGYWQGLIFESNADHVLIHALVEYAGSGEAGASVALLGDDEDNPSLLLENSTIRHSASYGLLVDEYSNVNADYATANTFEDNALGDSLIVPPDDDW